MLSGTVLTVIQCCISYVCFHSVSTHWTVHTYFFQLLHMHMHTQNENIVICLMKHYNINHSRVISRCWQCTTYASKSLCITFLYKNFYEPSSASLLEVYDVTPQKVQCSCSRTVNTCCFSSAMHSQQGVKELFNQIEGYCCT